MKIIDTHAHLDHLNDLDQALKEAQAAGVEGIVAVGEDLASNQKNLEIKKSSLSPKIYLALGMHPGNIKKDEIEDCLAFIRANIDGTCAIGEIGLDFWYKWVRKDKEKKDEQRAVFRQQLAIAEEFGRPAIIHSRGTWRECLETTKEAGVKRAVFHWYSGPVDVLKDILACGYFISATPSLAYSSPSREAMAYAPIEQTLIETDCPVFYRSLDGKDGFAARPKDVFKTLELYAQLKNMDQQEALTILNNNARKFFGMKGKT